MTSSLIKCPACGVDIDASKQSPIDYPALSIDEKLKPYKPDYICFCAGCSLGVALPILSDKAIDAIYEGGDYWGKYQKQLIDPHKNPGQFTMAHARWSYVRAHHHLIHGKPISILDIGGGHGFFGEAAIAAGATLEKYCIVEKDKFFRESLEFTWGQKYPKVTVDVQESMPEVTGTYDVIVLSHILEHVNDPKGLVKAASKYLTPHGVIFIDVPHRDFRFKKNVFPHVLFFNPQSLEEMGKALGFRVLDKSSFGRHPKDRFHALLEKIVYSGRRFLPLPIIKGFYFWFFQPNKANPNGIWVRMLLQRGGQ